METLAYKLSFFLIQSQDGTCMARDKTLDQMEYEDTILKNHRPKNTYVGLKGTVQILSEEDFANCKQHLTHKHKVFYFLKCILMIRTRYLCVRVLQCCGGAMYVMYQTRQHMVVFIISVSHKHKHLKSPIKIYITEPVLVSLYVCVFCQHCHCVFVHSN